ncbi:Aldo/keto reductase family protein [Streptomyces sp. S4.7]|nr:Aldo/keto reductase family protein [Streptomyces sp. S4.7]
MTDERKLDAVERLLPLAEQAGLSLTHMALAFAITHPGVTAAVIGPRTMVHLDDLLAGAATALDDDLLDRIDAIVPPGADVGPLDVAYVPPALTESALRRRQPGSGAAAGEWPCRSGEAGSRVPSLCITHTVWAPAVSTVRPYWSTLGRPRLSHRV